jgi:phosphoribosylformylglycinamidine synthase
MPIVSGNVSLYNETTDADGKATPVMPTPAIGGIGLLDDIDKMATVAFKAEGECLAVIGANYPDIGQSLWLREIHGREDGPPPRVDLKDEKLHGDIVRQLIHDDAVTAVHDISDGGLLVAVAEMALAGGVGASIDMPADGPPAHAWLFGEDQGRYLVAAADPSGILEAAETAGVPAVVIGHTGGSALTVDGVYTISLVELRAAHEGWMPKYMGSA